MSRVGIKGLLVAVALSSAFIALVPSEAHAQASGTGTGLWGEYFDNVDFSGARPTRTDPTVDFQDFQVTAIGTPTGLPATMTDHNNYIVRWQGMIEGPTGSTGTVTFSFRTDDGGRVIVDGKTVIDFWRNGGIAARGSAAVGQTATISMAVGEKHSVRLEMFEQGGGDGAGLDWLYTGQAVVAVPAINMYAMVANPRITPAGAPFTDSQVVRIVCDTIGTDVVIRYTTNGTDIATATDGNLYSGPLVITANTTLKTRAFRASMPLPSDQVQATFAVADTTAPTVTRIQSLSAQELMVTFSEPLNAAAAVVTGNYTLNAGGAVTAAALMPNLVSVRLTTTGLASGTPYLLTFPNAMPDRAAAPNSMPAGTAKAFTHRPPNFTALVDWYRFDEGTGTTAADASGSAVGGNGGTVEPTAVEPPAWVEGVFGTALYFNGINNAVVTSALEGVLGATSSMAVWLKTTNAGYAASASNFQGIVGTSDGAAMDVNFGYLDGSGQILASVGDGTIVDSNFTINDGNWHHLVITRDSGTGTLTIYVDGISRASAASGTGAKTTTFNKIGAFLNQGFSVQRFMGSLDEVQFYNAVLTAADVSLMYNRAPIVNAGPDQVVVTGGLAATLGNTNITDDGLPAPAAVTWAWTMVSGPGVVTFGAPTGTGTGTSANTTATFTTGGTYVLRLTANDGSLTGSDDVVIDLPKIAVNPTSGLTTTEAPTSTTFTVTLTTAPSATVTIDLSSDDVGEGTPDVTRLIFTTTAGQAYVVDTSVVPPTGTGGWNVPHTVTVTGVDDSLRDGDIVYHINFAASTSGDAGFAGIVATQVTLTNIDDDIPGITLSPAAGLVTTESGGSDSFTIVLNTQPTGGSSVTISIASTNPAEGTTDVTSLVFTATGNPTYNIAGGVGTADWSVPHTVTITGIDDAVLDFSITYAITTGAAVVTGTDVDYPGLDPVDPQVTNLDNEVIPTLDKVWGCGLMGLELLLPLGLAAFWRRRRRNA